MKNERRPLDETEDTALRNALLPFLQSGGKIITGFVVIVETIDPDSGEQIVEDIVPDQQPIWASIGFVDFVRDTWREIVSRSV